MLVRVESGDDREKGEERENRPNNQHRLNEHTCTRKAVGYHYLFIVQRHQILRLYFEHRTASIHNCVQISESVQDYTDTRLKNASPFRPALLH